MLISKFFITTTLFSVAVFAAENQSPDTLNSLGAASYAAGNYAEAEAHYTKALALSSPGSILAGLIANNLGVLYAAEGRFREAQTSYDSARAALANDSNKAEYARAVCNVAELERKQGNLTQAGTDAGQALQMLRQTSANPDSHFADCLETQAAIARAKDRSAEAEKLTTKALRIRVDSQGAQSAAAGVTMSNLAAVYISERRYAEAETYARRSVAVLEAAAGPDHPALAASLNCLAQVLRLRSTYVDVELLYTRALSIWAKRVGEEHPAYALTLANLADYDIARGQTAEGVRLYQRSVGILTAALGPQHPDVVLERTRLDAAEVAINRGWGRNAIIVSR